MRRRSRRGRDADPGDRRAGAGAAPRPRSGARRHRGAAAALCLILPAVAVTADDESGARPAAITGFVEARGASYPIAGDPRAAGWLRARLSWEKRLSERFIARAIGDLHAATNGDVERDDLYDDGERGTRRAPVGVEELTLAWTGRRADVTAGKMTIPWGRADGFNPTDNLTPFDALDPLDTERIALWALRGRLYASRLTLEAAWLPYPGVTRLPRVGDRWLPLPDEVPNLTHPRVGPGRLAASWTEGWSVLPDRGIENAAWAVKAEWRGVSWEGSISRYDGWDDQPILFASWITADPAAGTADLTLSRIQPALRATGADVAWVRGRFALRAEGAIHERTFPGARESFDFVFGVIEGEVTRGDWRFVCAWAGIGGADAIATTASSFEQGALPAAIVHVERSVPTGVGASVQLIANLDGDGRLVRAELSWPVAQAVRATVGADVITGPAGTFLGSFRRNDRARAQLRWSF